MTGSTDLHATLPGKEAAPVAGKEPYRAFETGKGEQRYLEIRLREPQPAECPSYGMLTHIRAEWRAGQAITLEYGSPMTMMVVIYGENLAEVYRAIKAWKVEWIAEYDAGEHDAPADESAPFIKRISIHTTRPEEAPPVKQRH